MMRRSLLFLLFPAVALANEGAMPSAVTLEHYQPLIKRSPFAPATAPVQAAPTASFAKSYYVTGVAEVGGRPFVTFSSRDKQSLFSLMEGESYEGMTLTKVEWSPEVGKTQAVLRRGTELGVVNFDEVAMKAAPPPPEATPQTAEAGRGITGRDRGEGRRSWGRGGNDQERRARRNYWRAQRRAAAAWYNGAGGAAGAHGNPGFRAPGNQAAGQNVHQRQQPINAPRRD